jgi:hypothetical protein
MRLPRPTEIRPPRPAEVRLPRPRPTKIPDIYPHAPHAVIQSRSSYRHLDVVLSFGSLSFSFGWNLSRVSAQEFSRAWPAIKRVWLCVSCSESFSCWHL